MKHIVITGLFFLSVLSVYAQQKLDKISQSIKVTDNVTIDLNTNYTNIEIDTWNKDIVEIEAYVESSNLSKEELKTYLDNWKIKVEGSNDFVSISSDADNQSWVFNKSLFDEQSLDALQNLEFELANIPDMTGLMESLNLAEMPKMPELPELPEGMTKTDFDYKKYEEEGDAYRERWSKEYNEKFGKEYAKRMENWAKQVESSEEMKDFERRMEVWEEAFGKRMEEQAKAREARMQAQEQKAQVLETREQLLQNRHQAHEARNKALEDKQRILFNSNSNFNNPKVKKTIKIKMPKGTTLKVNVRYGELKMASVINNLKAELTHTSLVANSIDGSQTSINASYSPVEVSNWLMGELKLNYVENAKLNSVNRLVLSANSSNIKIGLLQGNAIIDGSFGDLVIDNISDTFNNLNIVLENSNARVTLPHTDYNLQYKGKYSKLKHPKKTINDVNSSFSTGDLASSKTVVVNAKYSQIELQ